MQELAEFFRNEYITLLEERFEQLGEVSETGFTEELDALNNIVNLTDSLKLIGEQGIAIDDSALIELRGIHSALGGALSFMNGTGGFQNFGNGTLAFLHGREAVIPESGFMPFNQFQEAAGEMSVEINVNVNGGSNGTVETLARRCD